MASKMVTNQRKQCLLVSSAALESSRYPRVQEGLLRRFADVLPEGVTDLTVTQVQELLGQELEALNDRTITDDNQHFRELVTDYELRNRRDKLLSIVREKMLRFRNIFGGSFGPESSILLFGTVDQRIPTDATTTHQTGIRMVDWLRDPTLAAPDEVAGVVIDREAMAQSLEPDVKALGQTLVALGKERNTSVDSLVSKRRSLGNLGGLTDQGGRFMEALYDLAGMDEESDRVRLSSHQSSSKESEASEPDVVPGDGSGDGSGEESGDGNGDGSGDEEGGDEGADAADSTATDPAGSGDRTAAV